MSTDAAIQISGLTKHYPGVEALTDLTLDVPRGSIYGFLGPNGAGKSTTLKILGGLISPTRGRAAVGGTELDAGAAYRRAVGYLAQDPRFYDWMSGRETLEFVASLGADPGTRDQGWIEQVLRRVGLGDAADRPTRTYSGGMRQRLGIAQALVTRPQVLLLDEPVSALDPIGRREVLDLMNELKGETTIFFSTHILDDVQRVSDQVAIVDRGRLVRAASTASLLQSYTSDRLRVTLAGAGPQTFSDLAELPGAISLEQAAAEGGTRTYLIQIDPADAGPVQREVTRYASDHDMTLVENGLVRLDLEDVFLRLVDPQERAA